MPACVTAAAKGTRRVGVARMRGEAFVASNRHRIFASFATKQLETRDERLARLERECESLRRTLHTARCDLERAVEFKEAAERDNTRRFAVLLNAQKVRLREQHELLEAARAENDDLRARVEETDSPGDEGTDDGGESEPDTDEEEATAARARSTGVDWRSTVQSRHRPKRSECGDSRTTRRTNPGGSSQPSQKSRGPIRASGTRETKTRASTRWTTSSVSPPAGGDARTAAAAADDDSGDADVSQTLASASARLAGGGGGGVGSAGSAAQPRVAGGGGVQANAAAAGGGGGGRKDGPSEAGRW